MFIFTLIKLLVVLAIIYFIVTQITLPLIRSIPLFPWFRKNTKLQAEAAKLEMDFKNLDLTQSLAEGKAAFKKAEQVVVAGAEKFTGEVKKDYEQVIAKFSSSSHPTGIDPAVAPATVTTIAGIPPAPVSLPISELPPGAVLTPTNDPNFSGTATATFSQASGTKIAATPQVVPVPTTTNL